MTLFIGRQCLCSVASVLYTLWSLSLCLDQSASFQGTDWRLALTAHQKRLGRFQSGGSICLQTRQICLRGMESKYVEKFRYLCLVLCDTMMLSCCCPVVEFSTQHYGPSYVCLFWTYQVEGFEESNKLNVVTFPLTLYQGEAASFS